MASTVTLQEVVQWAMTQTKLVPIIGVGGYGEEPALSICNDVIQEMLSVPYNWKFNSKTATTFNTSTTKNIQDYLTAHTDIGWLEACTRFDLNSTQQPQPIEIMEVVRNLQPSSLVSNPTKIAFINETDAGGTFRLWPVPAQQKEWTICPVYQAKPPIKAGLQDTWAPIPDELLFVVRQGFLAMAYKNADDPRFDGEYKLFHAKIAMALGLKDAEGNSEGFTPDFGLFLG